MEPLQFKVSGSVAFNPTEFYIEFKENVAPNDVNIQVTMIERFQGGETACSKNLNVPRTFREIFSGIDSVTSERVIDTTKLATKLQAKFGLTLVP